MHAEHKVTMTYCLEKNTTLLLTIKLENQQAKQTRYMIVYVTYLETVVSVICWYKTKFHEKQNKECSKNYCLNKI